MAMITILLCFVFVCLGFVILFSLFLVCFVGGSDSLTSNEDIMKFRCEDGKSYALLCIFL